MRLVCFMLLSTMAVSSQTGCSDSANVATKLRQLTEEYPTATAAQLKARLDHLSVNEHWTLELMGTAPFKEAVFRKACEADANLTWSWLATKEKSNCAIADKSWQDYVAMHKSGSLPGGLYDNINNGRDKLLIYFKCQAGEIDKGSCDLYFSIQSQIDQGTAQTSQTIVDNIGNKCQVGVDANCYP